MALMPVQVDAVIIFCAVIIFWMSLCQYTCNLLMGYATPPLDHVLCSFCSCNTKTNNYSSYLLSYANPWALYYSLGTCF